MSRKHPHTGRKWALLGSAAVHLSLGVALVFMTSGRDPVSPDSMAFRIAVVVPPPEAVAVTADDRSLVADPADRSEAIDDASVPPRVARFDVDVEKIESRRQGLFPFVTTGLGFLDRLVEQVRLGESALVNPLRATGKALTPARRPPLRLTDAELQRIIDRAWSRRSRWNAFAEIADLLRTYDADTGQVPTVLRAYLDQNLLQLFCDASTRTPRFWAMIENAAEHIDFIEFVRAFTHDYPSSLATTELLFLVDKLAQASRDALLLLVDIDPDREATSPPGVGDELARGLQAHYRERLEHRQVHSLADITAWYDALRFRILSTIIATSRDGYRVSDARFLIGQMYFEHGDLTEAARWWREIRSDSRDSYGQEYSRLLDELRWPQGVRVRQIEYILDSVHSRWRMASLARLRHFGRTCDSY